MRKAFLLCILTVICFVANAQIVGPPYPQGSTYYNGPVISQNGYVVPNCSGKYVKSDGTGCGDPTLQNLSGGVWKRNGVVIYPDATFNNPFLTGEITVLPPDGDAPLLLTHYTQVWKAWFSVGSSIYYAESPDGINNWTWGEGSAIDGSSVAAHNRGRVIKTDSTHYYLYAVPSPGGTQLDEYISPDGLNFTLDHAAVITPAMFPPSWGVAATTLDNSSGVFISGTFYLAVDMEFNTGLWTSTDMFTFTPVGSDLMMPNVAVRSPFYQVGSTWYTWAHGTDNQIHRMSALTFTGTWSDALSGVAEFGIESLDEGVNLTNGPGTDFGQTVDPYVVQYNNRTYLYYSTAQATTPYNVPTNLNYSELKLAVANMPISSLILTNGGTDGVPENLGMLGLQFDYYTAGIDFKNRGITNGGTINSSLVNGAIVHADVMKVAETIVGDSDIQITPAVGQPLFIGSDGDNNDVAFDTFKNFRPYNLGSGFGSIGAPGQAWGKITAFRFYADGTHLTSTNFSTPVSGGWGTGSTITAIRGTDQGWSATITTGTGPTLNPSLTLTFADSSWYGNIAPICTPSMNGGTGVQVILTDATTGSNEAITYNGTPVSGLTYVIKDACIGSPN